VHIGVMEIGFIISKPGPCKIQNLLNNIICLECAPTENHIISTVPDIPDNAAPNN